MTPVAHFSPIYKKKEKKRKKMLTFKTAMQLTNSLIKKFREMKLIDNDDHCLPPKKRKLTENSTKVDSDIRSIVDCFMVDLSLDFESENTKFNSQHIPTTEPPPPLLWKNSEKTICGKRFNFFKKTPPRIRIKSSLKISVSRELRQEVTVHQLYGVFQNCVNFVQPLGYTAIDDIDLIVRYFSYLGKVLNIQDHWIKPRGSLNRYPSVWIGATVFYKNEEGYNLALKSFSVGHSSLVCVSVAHHLTRIDQVEARWASECESCKARGTSIVVEGFRGRMGRERFTEEFARYGTILDVRWKDGNPLQNHCEVTYKSTMNAVAAALALDGKSVLRCHLTARIKITEKEFFIHRKLRETF